MLQQTILQRMPLWTVFINKIRMLQQTILQRMPLWTVFINKIRMLQQTMLQRMPLWRVFINKIRMLQQTILQRMPLWTVFINKIRMLQQTQMLQRTRRNTIGRSSTRVRMTYRAFPLWLERQSSPLLSFVRFTYQFSSVICAFSSKNIFSKLFCYIISAMSQQNRESWMVTLLQAVGLE